MFAANVSFSFFHPVISEVCEAFPDSCICKLYADDIKFYSAMRTVNDCKNLQESLDVLYNWSCAWQ